MIDTLDDLIRAYQASPEAQCAPETLRKRNRIFERFRTRFPRLRLAQIDQPQFRGLLYGWRDAMRETPVEAQMTMKFVSVLLDWAADRGLLRDNPAARIRPLRRPVNRAECRWSPEQLRRVFFLAEVDLSDVLRVALWTGLRMNDVIALKPAHVEEDWLVVMPRKTARSSRVVLTLPYTLISPLHETIHRRRFHATGETLLPQNGHCWTGTWLREKLGEIRRQVGAEDLHFHDLRGTLVTWLFEAGCTDAEVGAITGHALSRSSNIRSYAGRTRTLATNAYTKLDAFARARGLY